MTLRIHDRSHNQEYRDRYNREIVIQPRITQTRVPLGQVKGAPAGRQQEAGSLLTSEEQPNPRTHERPNALCWLPNARTTERLSLAALSHLSERWIPRALGAPTPPAVHRRRRTSLPSRGSGHTDGNGVQPAPDRTDYRTSCRRERLPHTASRWTGPGKGWKSRGVAPPQAPRSTTRSCGSPPRPSRGPHPRSRGRRPSCKRSGRSPRGTDQPAAGAPRGRR